MRAAVKIADNQWVIRPPFRQRLTNAWQHLLGREPAPPRYLSQRVQGPGGVETVDRFEAAQLWPDFDPETLLAVLEEADSGNLERFVPACQRLAERDAQFGSQLGVRKGAVASAELRVRAPKDCREDVGEAVRAWVDDGGLKPAARELLDALSVGFAVVELVWDRSRFPWRPSFEWRDQRQFTFERKTGELRFNDLTPDGAPLAPYKWAVHVPKLRPGLPMRGGLARSAFFLHLIKSIALRGWARLLDRYGVPQAAAVYDPGLDDQTRGVARRALELFGRGWSPLVPRGIEFKVLEATAAGKLSEKLFSEALVYCDKQMSKLVLGQTMTADDGSSHSQATVHNQVRKDIREQDAEDLAETLNRDVVRAFVDVNFGVQDVYPRVFFHLAEPTDIVKMATALVPVMDRVPIKREQFYELLGLDVPQDGDEVVGGPRADRAGR